MYFGWIITAGTLCRSTERNLLRRNSAYPLSTFFARERSMLRLIIISSIKPNTT
ncbi:unnamed protein product [Victoria cruziana]